MTILLLWLKRFIERDLGSFSSQCYVVILREDVTCACVVWNTRARPQSKQVMIVWQKTLIFLLLVSSAREGGGEALRERERVVGKRLQFSSFPRATPFLLGFSNPPWLILCLRSRRTHNKWRVCGQTKWINVMVYLKAVSDQILL